MGVRVLLVARALSSAERPSHAFGNRARFVPGIDFAQSSSSRPNARWATTRVDGETVIELLCEPGNVPEPGREILISYGDKSNEELLFVHGFAERG